MELALDVNKKTIIESKVQRFAIQLLDFMPARLRNGIKIIL